MTKKKRRRDRRIKVTPRVQGTAGNILLRNGTTDVTNTNMETDHGAPIANGAATTSPDEGVPSSRRIPSVSIRQTYRPDEAPDWNSSLPTRKPIPLIEEASATKTTPMKRKRTKANKDLSSPKGEPLFSGEGHCHVLLRDVILQPTSTFRSRAKPMFGGYVAVKSCAIVYVVVDSRALCAVGSV